MTIIQRGCYVKECDRPILAKEVCNRPENLELWSVAQPKGQRVEDLIAWAHEIIDRYEGR